MNERQKNPGAEEPSSAEMEAMATLLARAVQAGLVGGIRWHREGEWLALRSLAVSMLGRIEARDHRQRPFLDLDSATAAFWHLIGHEPGFGEAGFPAAVEGLARLQAAERVFLYVVQTALVGTDEDWSGIEKMAALIDPPRVRRARMVREVETAIRQFHDPKAPTATEALRALNGADDAPVTEQPPFDAWPEHEAFCVRLLSYELGAIDDALNDLDPKIIYKWLKRAKPGKSTGAGNIGPVRVAAALALAAGGFEEARRDDETEGEALDRVEMKFRKALVDDTKRTGSKPGPGR